MKCGIYIQSCVSCSARALTNLPTQRMRQAGRAAMLSALSPRKRETFLVALEKWWPLRQQEMRHYRAIALEDARARARKSRAT